MEKKLIKQEVIKLFETAFKYRFSQYVPHSWSEIENSTSICVGFGEHYWDYSFYEEIIKNVTSNR